MTREEINKFLANTKIYAAGKSEEIQNKLFALGYRWGSGDAEVDNIDSPFLFIYPDMSFAMGRSMTYFSAHINREISAEEILSFEFTEKFTPTTLQPFDKVLARDTNSQNWSCDLFSNMNFRKKYPYICISGAYNMAIPYNDETKHLVGTNKEAPEYYRYWKE